MIDGWVLWLFLVGLAVGGVVTWLLTLRLPRGEADVDQAERPVEAAWISEVIEHHGGIAPGSLVEEVLDLHQVYLQRGRALEGEATSATSPPVEQAASYALLPPSAPTPGPAAWQPGPAGQSAPAFHAAPRQAAPGHWSPPPPVPGVQPPYPGGAQAPPQGGASGAPAAGIQPRPQSEARRPT